MEFIYVLVSKDCEWEDIVVYLSIDDAIKESIKHPQCRIEIFSKSDNVGYTPTYNYYKNGEFIHNS